MEAEQRGVGWFLLFLFCFFWFLKVYSCLGCEIYELAVELVSC